MPRRLALLVATYRYEDAGLRQLAAPGHDAEALAEVLRDPQIADFDVTVLVNEPHHVVGKAIGEFYRNRRRDDLTLLYFTGHGLKDDQGRLYLAMTNTKRDALLFTGLSAQQIDDAMEDCSSRQKVLMLDCCYSGAFPGGRISKADPQVHTLEKFQGKGRVVLTASDATQYSFEGNQIIGQGIRSVFTRFIVEGLTTGDADLDGDGDISLDELYSYVYDRVVEEMPQQRPKKQENVEGRILIARNIHWGLPASVRNALESPFARDRLAVLEGLAHLHRVGNDLVKAKIIDQTRRLIHDDSKAVSEAAMKLITALSSEQALREAEEQDRRETARQGATDPKISLFSRLHGGPAQRTPVPGPKIGADGTDPKIGADGVEGAPGARFSPGNAQPARPSDAETQTGGHVGLPHRWGLGRLTRQHMALAASAALAIISVVVVVVVVSTRSSTVTIPVGAHPTGVAVTSDGRHAYVANSGNVSVIDTTSNAVTATIPVGAYPRWVAVTPDGRNAYVTNTGPDVVSVIDTTGITVTATIPVGIGPRGVAVTPDGRHAYVTNTGSNSVSVIDTANSAVSATIPVGTYPRALAVTPDGRHAYVANQSSNNVSVIDTASNAVTATIPVGSVPRAVAVTGDGRHAYVTNTGPDDVSVIDTASNAVTATIPVGTDPWGVAVSPDGRHAYVTNTGPGDVSVIDTASNAVTATIPVGTDPRGVAVSPDGRHAYVTNAGSNNVSVIEIDAG